MNTNTESQRCDTTRSMRPSESEPMIEPSSPSAPPFTPYDPYAP